MLQSPCRTTGSNKLPRIFNIVLSSLLLIFLLLSLSARAQAMDIIEVARRLQSTYEKADNVVADFNQRTTMKFSSRIREGSGTMIFSKPGHMRWDYLTPEYQVLISDGETISMYFKKSNQMIISNAREYLQSDVTYAFFAGTGDILRDFDVSDPDIPNNDKSTFLLKLTPKTLHPHVSSLYVWVARDTFLITHMRIVDHFDTVTDLYFSSVRINADHYGDRDINEKLFIFIPPANTEIIEQN